MNFDSTNPEPKLMISDSLEGVLPDEASNIQFDELFIMAIIKISQKDISLAGSLAGVEFGENPKLDLKVSLKDAFSFISNVLITKDNLVEFIILAHGQDIVTIPGPFSISNTKIIEIDPTNRTCVFAIDLIKTAS